MINSLPEGVVNASKGLGFNLETAISSINLDLFTNENIVKAFIDNIASDIIMTVLDVVVFVVLFIIISFEKLGDYGDRTHDLLFTRETLCH